MTSSAQLHSSLSLCLRRCFSVSTTSASSSSATSVPAHPPRPVINYNRITSNRNACAKNLVDRKSHLTPDAIEDVARDGPGASGYPFGFRYPLTFSAKSDIRIPWRIPAGPGGYPRGYPRISAPKMTPRLQNESFLGKFQMQKAA
ncbi:Serine--tRNA ligase, mitochondrial [Puccinia graminis f. sp. tritici]|uniref:Serine--tRNA ligase, mitochondrial n=1 Tax=Puccinia graminis f. sp. tritici TaxID=56615 RepID=A0A5B0RUF8_PUCGR|nr:Serine--tRNA ligase, mitochondrial [Puccinia graminis f. sp. tritici]